MSAKLLPRIRLFRFRRGLAPEFMAHFLGFDAEQYRAFERGHYTPNLAEVYALRLMFGDDLDVASLTQRIPFENEGDKMLARMDDMFDSIEHKWRNTRRFGKKA